MSGSVAGKTLPCIILIVLCYIVGVQAAENIWSSFLTVAALIGAVFMVIMGRRSWCLLFLLPPIIGILPLPESFRGVNKGFLVAPCILTYWLFMWSVGGVKIKWRSLWLLDLLVLALMALIVMAFIKRPVAISALGLDFDNIGGKVYFIAFFGLLYYISISCIPVTYTQLCKVLNWQIWVTLICVILTTLRGLLMGDTGGEEMTMAEGASETRFSAFSALGRYVGLLLFAHFSLIRFAVNPLLIFGMLASLAAIALSGFRSSIAGLFLSCAGMSVVKREFSLLVLLGGMAYGVLLALSAGGVTESLPYGIQRTLAAFPGVEVNRDARRDAEESTEWRIEMWVWAMDSRTNYIKDYVWGDGVGISKSALERNLRAEMRGEIEVGAQEQFAAQGDWHNMCISVIQHMGYVGLATMVLFMTYLCWLVFRTSFAVKGTPLLIPVLVFLTPYFSIFVMLPVAGGTIESLYGYFSYAALAKLVFCVAREEGLLLSVWQRKKYIPRMIQEYEGKLNSVNAVSSL